MTYPTAVVLVAAVVTGILLVKVVPQFQSVFPASAPNCQRSP